jgi:hypothetical protein
VRLGACLLDGFTSSGALIADLANRSCQLAGAIGSVGDDSGVGREAAHLGRIDIDTNHLLAGGPVRPAPAR